MLKIRTRPIDDLKDFDELTGKEEEAPPGLSKSPV